MAIAALCLASCLACLHPIMDMEMDQSTSVKLIKLYESKAALWDKQHPEYYMKKLRMEYWREISEEMGRPIECVKQKIVNLSGTYRHFRCRHKNTGKCTWYAYDAFAFMEKRRRRSQDAHDDTIIKTTTSVAGDEEEVAVDDNVSERSIHYNNEKVIKKERVPAATWDECAAFGEYVAHSMRKHTARTQAIIKHAINNVLFEHEMNSIQENPFND